MEAIVYLLVFVALLTTSCSVVQSKKQEENLEGKVQQMMEWSSKKSVIRLNANLFKQYVKAAPKNYSVMVMLTALHPQRGCTSCQLAKDEFEILANSWRFSQEYTNSLFFTMIDYDEDTEIFHSMKINTAPVFMHFPAKGKQKKADTMDTRRIGVEAGQLAFWILDRTGIKITIYRPPNYSGILAVAVIVSMLGGLLYFKPDCLDFLSNRTSMGIFTLAIIFSMTSGQMWNHIRGPPMMHKDPNSGQIKYINSNGQGQFIVETYIVMLLNTAVVVGFIIMNEASEMKCNAGKKKIASLFGLGCVAVFFSVLLSVFRTKNHGYPYSFLFK